LSKNKKVLEMIITQALKVSNDLVNVVYIVSQVPWKHPYVNHLNILKRKIIMDRIRRLLIFTMLKNVYVSINEIRKY